MRSYVLILLLGIPSLLGFIALSNFLIDPGNVYLNRIYNQQLVEPYIDLMLRAQHGVVQEGWNERDVKLSLARRKNQGACLVLGSSQIMTVSILQGDGLNRECKKLVNLGVSGAGIEDLAIFSETLIAANPDPDGSRVYIAVSPWLFNFNRDSRYVPYREIYRDFRRRTGIIVEAADDQQREYFLSWLSNLISADYFRQVIKNFATEGAAEQFARLAGTLSALRDPDAYVGKFQMPEFDRRRGADSAVTLSDGSHVYNRAFIGGQHEMGGGLYKLDDSQWLDQEALDFFESLLLQLDKNGFEVRLLLTPYHPEVWEEPSGRLARNIMLHYSKITHELAERLDLEVLGSYDPRVVGCGRDDFYDFMHPVPACINRIFLNARADTL